MFPLVVDCLFGRHTMSSSRCKERTLLRAGLRETGLIWLRVQRLIQPLDALVWSDVYGDRGAVSMTHPCGSRPSSPMFERQNLHV
jgi:hypothetical protein